MDDYLRASLLAREQYLRSAARLERMLARSPGDYETRGAVTLLWRMIAAEQDAARWMAAERMVGA